MFKRTVCGGKGGSSSYDPQIGEATKQTAATAARAEAFAEDYYKNYVAPTLKQTSESNAATQTKLGNLYDINAANLQQQSDRYKQFGIPAENAYYAQASKFSAPDYQEQQAQSALGDMKTAQQSQQGQLDRQLSGSGIDPSSPAALAARADAAVRNSAMDAGAMNQARMAAQKMGLGVAGDVANFGRGGQSMMPAYSQAATSNATSAFGAQQGLFGNTVQAGQFQNPAMATAISGYGNNADVYGKMGAADLQAQASSGLGALVGQLGSAAIAKSDRRLKENLIPVGVTPSGITIYIFDYIDGPKGQTGVMAQDVLPIIPDAVHMNDDGYYSVDYRKLR